jgi:hypothetical protein
MVNTIAPGGAGASKEGLMRKAVRLFSKDSGQNVASLKARRVQLGSPLGRACEVKNRAR